MITDNVLRRYLGLDEYDLNQPRDEYGRWTSSGIQQKINSVKIDFTKDNILPELNEEDLEELGVESKPVLLKKSVVDRNLREHPDVKKEDYNKIIGEALYNPDAVFPANAEKPYFNFLARLNNEKSSVVLLEVANNKDNYEIVHLHWAKNKQRRGLARKGEKIKNGWIGRTPNPI